MKPYKMGIDLGGTKTESILLDSENNVAFRKRIHTPRSDGYSGILESLLDLISDTAKQIPRRMEYSIGIGIPGAIDPGTGLVHNANTTCLIGEPFQKDIERLAGRPVVMENDANCFTLAECRSGAAKGYNLVFGIIMGTGCGGAFFIHDSIRKGRHSIAGEWGHFSIDPLGDRCYCGNTGCIETKISGSGVASSYFKKFGKPATMTEIVDGYHKGRPDCVEIFLQFLDDFGRSLGGLISTVDPDAVVIGGGLSNIDELYLEGLARVRHYAFHRNIQTPVLKNKLGDSAGVYGAAWLGAEASE